MERAGFYISPAQHISLQKAIDIFGIEHIEDITKLKQILSPIIAKGPGDQDQFYQVFDQYIEDVKRVPHLEAEPELRIPKWIYLLPLLLLIPIFWAISPTKTEEKIIPELKFEIAPRFKINDTLRAKNLTIAPDTTLVKYRWEMRDKSSLVLEALAKNTVDWNLPLRSLKPGSEKLLWLINENGIPTPDTAQRTFEILCEFPPDITLIKAIPTEISESETVVFTVDLKDETTEFLDFEWNFGDGAIAYGMSTEYTFNNIGVFNVLLTVTRNGTTYPCQTLLNHEIRVGQKAWLSERPLRSDAISPFAFYKRSAWVFWGVLGLITLFLWFQWIGSIVNKRKPQDPDKELDNRFSASDKGPYYIPFQNQYDHIQPSDELYKLADTMRIPQEGLRKELDVFASLKGTIEKGGFPKITLKTNKTPSEYLILIDEPSRWSHQAKLGDYVVKFLKDQDVFVDVYHYNNHFHRFWNSANPKGVSAEILSRKYPNHKLIVIGDGKGLIDPFSASVPSLKKSDAKHFLGFKTRMLWTPIPALNWTYEENTLDELFSIFPLGRKGIQMALASLENAAPDAATFGIWRTKMQTATDGLPMMKRTKRWVDYKKHFKDRPDLLVWLAGLSVFPQPTFELTIAIGHSLEKYGVRVNYENLLELSKIPWLQTGNMPSRLRGDMLDHLNKEQEKLAREAVLEELNIASQATMGSHAQFDVETATAVNNFALSPQNAAHREAMQYLVENKLVPVSEETHLEKSLNKSLPSPPQNIQTKGGSQKRNVNLHQYLGKRLKAPKQEKPSLLNRHLIAPSLGTLALILSLITLLNTDKTDRLYRWAFKERPTPAVEHTQRANKETFFVKEGFQVDSAVYYNNKGVDTWYGKKGKELTVESAKALSGMDFLGGLRLFEKAVLARKDYSLGIENLANAYFNIGRGIYHAHLDEEFNAGGKETPLMDSVSNTPNSEPLQIARTFFKQSEKFPSAELDSWHALGLAYYFDDNKALLDSARFYYNLLVGKTYFDTLSIQPNLHSFLEEKEDIVVFLEGRISDQKSKQPISNVKVSFGGQRTTGNAVGKFSLTLKNPVPGQMIFQKSGYKPTYYNINKKELDQLILDAKDFILPIEMSNNDSELKDPVKEPNPPTELPQDTIVRETTPTRPPVIVNNPPALDEPTRKFMGFVKDQNGDPLEGAVIFVDGKRKARTNTQGKYEFTIKESEFTPKGVSEQSIFMEARLERYETGETTMNRLKKVNQKNFSLFSKNSEAPQIQQSPTKPPKSKQNKPEPTPDNNPAQQQYPEQKKAPNPVQQNDGGGK